MKSSPLLFGSMSATVVLSTLDKGSLDAGHSHWSILPGLRSSYEAVHSKGWPS